MNITESDHRLDQLLHACVEQDASDLHLAPGLPPDEWIDNIPFPETQNYVKRILGTAEDYRRLYGDDARVPTVNRPPTAPTKSSATQNRPTAKKAPTKKAPAKKSTTKRRAAKKQ